MPTNVYGPGDNYHPENSHVVAALIRRFHESKQHGATAVTVWGTGKPRREFLFVDDLADACVFLLENYSGEQHVNVGSGAEVTIAQFAALVAEVSTLGHPPRVIGVFRREDLHPGAKIAGPAVIAERNATTIVEPEWEARVTGQDHLVLERVVPRRSEIIFFISATALFTVMSASALPMSLVDGCGSPVRPLLTRGGPFGS